MKESDPELAALFARLGVQDEGAAPPWRSVFERPPRPLSDVRLRWRSWAAVAAAAALVAVVWPRERPPAKAFEFAAWRSPTSVLLRGPGISLWCSSSLVLPSDALFSTAAPAGRRERSRR